IDTEIMGAPSHLTLFLAVTRPRPVERHRCRRRVGSDVPERRQCCPAAGHPCVHLAAGCLALKIFLVRRFGMVGVPWATLLSYAALSAIPCLFIVPRLLSSMERRHAGEWAARPY